MNDEHAVVGALVGHADLHAPPEDEHERADLLAAYEAGALSEADAASVERWLAEDDGLRMAWLALRADDVVHAQPGRPVRSWMRPLLVAAAVLAAFGTWRWLDGRAGRTTPTVEERLALRVEALREGEARWLEALPTLDGTQVATQPDPVYRDGLAALAPLGRQLRVRPVFRYVMPLGATGVTIRVEDEATGKVVFEGPVDAGRFAWPAERPALSVGRRYLWQISARTLTGAVDATASFEIADTEERTRMSGLLDRLSASTDEDDHLLAVVIALDHGFRQEAASRSAKLPAKLWDTALGKRLRSRLGLPDAVAK